VLLEKAKSDREEQGGGGGGGGHGAGGSGGGQQGSLAGFVIEFMLFKYGARRLVRIKLAELFESLRHFVGIDPWLTLFARLCGLVDPLDGETLHMLLWALEAVQTKALAIPHTVHLAVDKQVGSATILYPYYYCTAAYSCILINTQVEAAVVKQQQAMTEASLTSQGGLEGGGPTDMQRNGSNGTHAKYEGWQQHRHHQRLHLSLSPVLKLSAALSMLQRLTTSFSYVSFEWLEKECCSYAAKVCPINRLLRSVRAINRLLRPVCAIDRLCYTNLLMLFIDCAY
jgi:hypothetical protein